MNRRTLLAGALSGGVVFLAGCIGGDNGPEGIVEQYLEARIDGDEDEIESYVHETSDVPTSPTDSWQSVVYIEQMTLEEYADRFDAVSESDVRSEVESQASAADAEEWEYFYATVETDLSEDSNLNIIVGLIDDDWLII